MAENFIRDILSFYLSQTRFVIFEKYSSDIIAGEWRTQSTNNIHYNHQKIRSTTVTTEVQRPRSSLVSSHTITPSTIDNIYFLVQGGMHTITLIIVIHHKDCLKKTRTPHMALTLCGLT